jgi:hypothetical protein
LLPFLLAIVLTSDSSLVYDGRANRIHVDVPRMDSVATIDGNLSEPVWNLAARLTGFSQYQPVDGRPADEPTEVLVWYAPDAIYFGIKARELHGNVVRATHANRDNIDSEDQIQILLDTDNSRQIAFLFGVNPYGVQQDGTRSAQFSGGAGGPSATGGGFRTINPLEGSVDLNPDYFFESKGRLVDGGYEVEVRIPFKSLRYQDARVQSWGLHILRRIQHSGFQDTWAPAVRANANFLAQSGTLEGLHDLKRGLVLEATPTMTARADRAPTLGDGTYQQKGELGGDVRWGIRQNLTLNGTINPDFSQVEADVGQVLLNERFALFYPEKRPFFLDGLELFDSPNQLIYTRQIVAPLGGVKLTGKLGGTNIASMVVADDRLYSWENRHSPLYGVSRLRYDFGSSNTLGAVLTTREDGSNYSRVASGDFRFYHSRLYFAQFQAASSWTDSLRNRLRGSIVQGDWDRTGRAWGFHYTLRQLGPDFRAATGFVNRTGIIEGRAFNRLSFYGAQGALLQTVSTFFGWDRIWNNRGNGHGMVESSESVTPSATIRGGWQLGGAVTHGFFAYDPPAYSGYAVQRSASAGVIDTLSFVVPGPEKNEWGGSLRLTTPTYRHFSSAASITRSQIPIFREAAQGTSSRIDATLDVRPTNAIRSSLQLSRLTIARSSDGSRFSSETIPRLKVEYQVSPPIFLRLVGQYAARSRSTLRDRNGSPILVNGVLDAGDTSNQFSTDWLFSYRPVPGTLVYLGYGSTLEEPREFRFQNLQRTRDGFFGKVSYLFRL